MGTACARLVMHSVECEAWGVEAFGVGVTRVSRGQPFGPEVMWMNQAPDSIEFAAHVVHMHAGATGSELVQGDGVHCLDLCKNILA